MSVIKEEYPLSELTGRIIKCCLNVHNFLGPGFPEAIYHQALLKELTWEKLHSVSEQETGVRYKDGSVLGTFRPDIVVEGKVIVELKALTGLTDEHISQVLNYLKATNLQIGLLINFGERSLAVKRLRNKYYDPSRRPYLESNE